MTGSEPHPFFSGQAVTPTLDDPQWRHANLILEQRYLALGRAQIDDMCLDLKARLAARMSAGLQERLELEQGRSPADLILADMSQQVETAAAMAEKLLSDISWVLPWEQAQSLVEPFAKGSWLLAQIQAMEEQRVVAIFATELLQQATDYMRELIFRSYGAERMLSAEPVSHGSGGVQTGHGG